MKADIYDMLICSQCGEYHPKSNHRKYFPSQSKGESYYKQCKRCERINKRYIYLQKKLTPTVQDIRDIEITELLYKELQARGLEVPSVGKGPKTCGESAITLLNKITKGRVDISNIKPTALVDERQVDERFINEPKELIDTLYRELHGLEPEELYREYDELRAKYAPQVGVGQDFAPIWDTAHSEILQAILERIETYEDELY